MKMIDFQALPNNEVAHQSGTVGSSAATLVSHLSGGALHAQTNFVRVSVDTADVRLTVDGTTPTASLGRLIPYDSSVVLSLAEALLAKLIRAGGSDGTVQINQYKA